MTVEELRSYAHTLTAHADSFRKRLMEIAVFSEGAISYSDILYMPLTHIKDLEEIIAKKVKLDKNIKSKEML